MGAFPITNTQRTSITLESGDEFEASNHLDLILQLSEVSDQVLFVSPFLYGDFEGFFGSLENKNLKMELITTCAVIGDDQYGKPFSLRSFGANAKSLTRNWPTMGIDDRLHSKVYAFFRSGEPLAAVVTSAQG